MEFTSKHRYLPTSETDGSGTTARMGFASAAVVGTILWGVDDNFAEALIR